MTKRMHSIEHLQEDNANLRRRVAELETRNTRTSNVASVLSQEVPLNMNQLLDNLPGMVYRCRNDPDWTMEYVSAGAIGLTGYSPADLREHRVSYASLILSEDRGVVWDSIQAALADRRSFELVYRVCTSDNILKWVWERGWGIWSEQADLLALEGFITDISALKQTEDALRTSERRYRQIVENSHEGIWMLDPDGRTQFANTRIARMLGYGVEEMQGKSILDFMSDEWRDTARKQIERVSDRAEERDFKFIRKDGSEIWTLLATSPLLDESGGTIGTLAMAVDITERKQMEATLQQRAVSDPLTGLLNRRHFYQLAQQELERFRRYRYPLAAIMLDLDHFKQINDKYGHLVGDQILQAVSRILQESLRRSDILCRFGGEEFAILLPETDNQTAFNTAERLRTGLSGQSFETARGPVTLTASLGVAGIPAGSGLDLETLLDYADRMLYSAKEGGRNRVAMWPTAGGDQIPAMPPPPSE